MFLFPFLFLLFFFFFFFSLVRFLSFLLSPETWRFVLLNLDNSFKPGVDEEVDEDLDKDDAPSLVYTTNRGRWCPHSFSVKWMDLFIRTWLSTERYGVLVKSLTSSPWLKMCPFFHFNTAGRMSKVCQVRLPWATTCVSKSLEMAPLPEDPWCIISWTSIRLTVPCADLRETWPGCGADVWPPSLEQVSVVSANIRSSAPVIVSCSGMLLMSKCILEQEGCWQVLLSKSERKERKCWTDIIICWNFLSDFF